MAASSQLVNQADDWACERLPKKDDHEERGEGGPGEEEGSSRVDAAVGRHLLRPFG